MSGGNGSSANDQMSGAAAAGTSASASTSTGTGTSTAATAKNTADRDRRRGVLRRDNALIWERGSSPPEGPFDSNIKKNTGFIKRVRQTLGLETKDQLVREIGTLNLDKYVDEVVQAIPEGLSKCANAKDYMAAAETISALFKRFGPVAFAAPLSVFLAGQLQMPAKAALQALPADQKERDEAARIARQRVLLRASAELAIIDIVRVDKGKGRAADDAGMTQNEEWLFVVLRDLLASDREHSNAPILIALLKGLASTLVGQKRTNDASTIPEEEEASLFGLEAQSRFRKLCETYQTTLTRRMLREHERLQEQDRRNHEAYIRSGEIFEDRQQNYDKMVRSFEKVQDWTYVLSDLLGIERPSLTSEAKSGTGVGLAVNLDKKSGVKEELEAQYASGKSIWEDEDTRRFYEDNVDLADLIPPAVLGFAKGQAEEQADEHGKTRGDGDAEPRGESEKATSVVESPRLPHDEGETGSEEAALNAGPAAQLNALLARLPELSSRNLIDSAAVEFAFIANKLARRKLVKQLIAVPRHRNDLIPYYARLVAALNKYMPDVGQGIIAALEEEFRYLQKKRIPELAEMRTKNMRFLGELVKFRVAPLITTFHCFKVLLDDFHRTNVESLAILLETCGRFLLRSPDTNERMQTVLELLRRKRTAQNLDQRLVVLLDNAYYQCNPPEREAVEAKQRTPMELYTQSLIYDELNRQTVEIVLKRIRKLPWKDASMRETLQNAFVRSWRIKFGHLHLLAVLLNELQVYHPDFVVYVIDTICEQIRVGMEANIFRDNQRRVATIKYLGELYNYRLIKTGLVFEVLWSLVSFGHPNGQPLPGQVSSIDAPDDYFRVRLVCTLLDTCGHCFDRGSPKKRLDDFLLFFNMYILSKDQPLPMDTDFMLSDTLEALRPRFTLKFSFEEAATAVDEMLANQRAKLASHDTNQKMSIDEAPNVVNEALSDESSGSDSDGEDSDVGSGKGLKPPRHASKDDAGTDSESTSGDDSGSDEDEREEMEMEEEGISRREGQSSVDQEAEDEFARELAKMMAESSVSTNAQSGRNQRNLFDIGMPFVKKMQAQTGATAALTGEADPGSSGAGQGHKDENGTLPPQHMRFSLLSKRGNKQQTHEVHVPMDAALAVHSRANEQQQLAEREQLKKLVLGMETRETSHTDRDLDARMWRRGAQRPRQDNASDRFF